jgi:hypothetical protein
MVKRISPAVKPDVYRTRSQIALSQKVESAIYDRGYYNEGSDSGQIAQTGTVGNWILRVFGY